MSGFGLNESLPVEAKTKTLEPSPKGVAADETGKPTEQATTAPGLPTPESTPGPDPARLEADKERQKKEAAKVPVVSDSPSGTDTTDVTVNKGKELVKLSQSEGAPDASPENAPDNGQRKYTDNQKLVAERVLACEPSQYYDILGVPDPSPLKKSQEAYKKLAKLLHPDKNKYERAIEAFKRRRNSRLFLRDIQDPRSTPYFDIHLTSYRC